MEQRYARLLTQTGWVGCLLGATGTWYLVFGLAGAVGNALLNYSVLAALSIALGFFIWQFGRAWFDADWAGRLIWIAILLILIVEAILGLLPPSSRDELTHHLAIPKLYAQAGRIIEVPMAPYAYYPMLLDMLYTPWLVWGYDFVPKWIHLLYGALTGLLLYAYLAWRMSPAYGLLGFFFFLSTPMILRLSHWGYIDLGITFYAAAALLALLRWREERKESDDTQHLVLAGASLGFALATKPNGLVVALIVTLLVLMTLAKPPRRSFLSSMRELFTFGVLAALPFLPWLAKNWAQTGNPLFPFLGGWFAQKSVSGMSAASFPAIGIFDKRELLYGENIWQLATLPLRVFFSGQDDNPQYFDGVLTPALILFLPWAFKGKWLGDKRVLMSFAVLLLLYATFLVDMRIRYVLPIVPALVVLLVYGAFNVYIRIRRPAWLFAALAMFAVWHGGYLWGYVRDARPTAYLTGHEDRSAYLRRALPEYRTFEFINQRTPLDAKIYLLFVGRRAYYCHRNYFHDGGDLPGFLVGAIRAANDPSQIEQALKQRQITHLMLREDLLTGFLAANLDPAKAQLWNQFATSRLSLEFRDGVHAVYRLHG
jgi:hypothetical protein